jgi:hypothetical protein
LKNKAQANNRFRRNNIKLFLERPRCEQKGLTPQRFTAALNNEVKGGALNTGNAAVAWYATHNTRWELRLISIVIFKTNESPIIPGVSLPPVVWVAANGYHLLIRVSVVLMILCAAPDSVHPIVIKIRGTVTLQDKEVKIIFESNDSTGLSVEKNVTTQLILISGVKK